jgi:hypothetical protein
MMGYNFNVFRLVACARIATMNVRQPAFERCFPCLQQGRRDEIRQASDGRLRITDCAAGDQ